MTNEQASAITLALPARSRTYAPVLLAVGLLGKLSSAYANVCPAPSFGTDALAAQDTGARIRFLRQSLHETARLERRFVLGWSLTYTALSVGSPAALLLSDDPGARVDAYFGMASSAFAAVVASIRPLLVIRNHRRLERLLLNRVPDCALLREAERLLQDAANNERGARNAFAHVSSFLFNLALGLTLGYGLDRPATAARNTTIGLVLGELMIFSRPTYAIRSLEQYQKGDLRPLQPAGGFSLDVALHLGSGGTYSLALGGSF